MTPEQRVELEARVDRAVRRGDLSQARSDLVELLASFPEDERLRSRLEAFESTALPGELRPSRPSPPDATLPPAEAPEVHAERLVQEGDLPGALAAYRRAVHANPENELLRERLAELFEQVRHQGEGTSDPDAPTAADPASAGDPGQEPGTPDAWAAVPSASAPSEAPEVPVASPTPHAESAPSPAASSPSSPPPGKDAVASQGHDPVARLEQLLERLQERRRPL